MDDTRMGCGMEGGGGVTGVGGIQRGGGGVTGVVGVGRGAVSAVKLIHYTSLSIFISDVSMIHDMIAVVCIN